ncbi:VPS10 domain-containing receptor SorCS2 [Crocuta crocuta]
MVHWTGENSSVILILTKYYHADMGKVLESSLWRSSDFGTSYTKLTLQPGVTTVIDNFYICPTNKRKIVLVSSSLSDRDQSLFLSTDEGATFQKQLVPFAVETLIFHPKEEDKVLAYSKESKLYVSSDLGKKWTLLQERVTKDHVFWAVSGVDADPDLVHIEAQDLGGGFRYVTCHVHNCSDSAPAASFPGPIDHSSLTVQDDYIFLKTTSTNRTKYYISYRRNEFVLMKLPKYALPKVSDGGVCAALSTLPRGRAGTGDGQLSVLGDLAGSPGPAPRGPAASRPGVILLSTLPRQAAGPFPPRQTPGAFGEAAGLTPDPALQGVRTAAAHPSRQRGRMQGSLVVAPGTAQEPRCLCPNPSLGSPGSFKDVVPLKHGEQCLVSTQCSASSALFTQPSPLRAVRGVKGVFLANQKTNGKVVTLITYNKGRDWDRLRPPSMDMNGKPTNCEPPDCHLHLHLRWADNPYVSGTVHTKDTAPGLIMGAGNLGSQLVEYKEEMYITSDCGHTWRQTASGALLQGRVYVPEAPPSAPPASPAPTLGSTGPGLGQGRTQQGSWTRTRGAPPAPAVVTPLPCRFSVDEGLTWSTHNFTSTSVFVDGLLSEPGDETLVMTVFGHISFRSDWELVKVDFRPSFSRPCGEDDYSAWHLSDLQGDRCIMGQQRSFRKRKPTSWCVKGKSFTSALESRVCRCRESDFLCDYGFERSPSSEPDANKCFANFWFNPLSPPDDCVVGQAYTSSLGYRKVVSNVCEGGVDPRQSPAQMQCPLAPPRGLQVSIRGRAVAVRPGEDVLFVVRQEQGDVLTTKYQVDLGDGFKATYVNLTLTEEPIRHRYESPGVYRVSVRAENTAGRDEALLFVQVNSPLQALHLEVVPVVGVNQEVNLTAVLLPLNPNLTVFYWWIGHSLQPLLSLENSVTTRFADTGDVRVTVQAACGNSVLQASKLVRVLDQFQVVPLQFSRDLDAHNPNTPEWREDVGLVVTRLLSKETSIPEELLVTVVKPGLPTVADLAVLLPPPGPTRKRSLTSDKRLLAIQQVLKAQKISFLLRGGVRVLVAMRDTDTDSQRLGGGGGYWAVAVLVVIGLFAVGVFILYKFKRKRPGRTVYAQMHNEKEQEMTSPVSHSQGVQSTIQGNHSGVVLSINSREMHSYLVS